MSLRRRKVENNEQSLDIQVADRKNAAYPNRTEVDILLQAYEFNQIGINPILKEICTTLMIEKIEKNKLQLDFNEFIIYSDDFKSNLKLTAKDLESIVAFKGNRLTFHCKFSLIKNFAKPGSLKSQHTFELNLKSFFKMMLKYEQYARLNSGHVSDAIHTAKVAYFGFFGKVEDEENKAVSFALKWNDI